MEKLRNKKLLHRYLMSFLLVLILPITLLGYYFVTSLNQLLERQTLDIKRGFLTETSSQMNGLLDGLAKNAYRLSNGSTTIRYKIADPVKWGADIISELDSARNIAVIAQEIYIYSPSFEYAYSNTSTYTRERFVRYFTQDAMSAADFDRFLDTFSTKVPTHIYQNGYVDAYFPLPTYHSTSDTYLIFRLDPNTFEDLLVLDNTQGRYMFGIYRGDHTLLAKTGGLDPELAGEMRDLMKLQSSTENYPLSTVLSVDGQRYDIFIDHYPVFDWYYCYVSPQNKMVSTVLHTQQRHFFAILVVLLLGGALCFVFTYFSYKPIQQLSTRVKNILTIYGENAVHLNARNELDMIQAGLQSLQSSLDEFTNAGSLSSMALRQFFITSLLNGHVTDYPAVVRGLGQLGIPLEGEFLTAAVIILSGEDCRGEVTVCNEYLDLLDAMSSNELSLYAVNGSLPNQINVLMTSIHDDIHTCAPILSKLQEMFLTTFRLSTTIGVGKSYPELRFLSISYMQAVQTVERRRLRDHGNILFSGNIPDERSIDTTGDDHFFPNVQHILPEFRQAVQEHAPDRVAVLLKHMAEEVDLQVVEVQFLLAYVLEILVSSFYTSSYEADTAFYSKYQLDAIRKVTTTAQLRAFVTQLSMDMENIIKNSPQPSSGGGHNSEAADTTMVERIRAYINCNLHNSQLSVSKIAREMEVSSSHLCRYYKEKTGDTVLEYINDQRVELAKRLLKETDLTIESIVTRIGYASSSSFIRKFSRRFGVTPGKYREEHQKDG